MYDVDKWLIKAPQFRIKTYNCWHFTRDVWHDWTGEWIDAFIPDRIKKFPDAIEDAAGHRAEIERPVNPCIAYYPKARRVPHIGIYLDRSVLHLSATGPQLTPVSRMREAYGEARYYR